VKNIIQEDIEKLLAERHDLERLDHQTMLISGANSFLMSYFIYLVLEYDQRTHSDIKILALCRDQKKAKTQFAAYLEDPHFSLLLQDVRDPVSWGGEIDICIHAASPVGSESRWEKSLETFEANLFGCKNLLELAREKHSRRFMLISSVDVYGDCPVQGRRKETDTGVLDWTYVRNAYSLGKRAAETLCSFYYTLYGMPCVTVRPVQIYGPGVSLTDGRLHGDFVRQLQTQNQIVLKSDGSALRSFMYISDATHALLDVLLYGKAGERYNICDEAGECSVKELAELYAKRWGNGAGVVFDWSTRNTPEVKDAISVVTGDSGKLRELGWKSRTDLNEGIQRTLTYYTCGDR